MMEFNDKPWFWWTPGSTGDKVIGKLYAKEDTGFVLETYSWGLGDSPGNLPVIYGELDGNYVTLLENTLFETKVSELPVFRYKPGVIIKGALLGDISAGFCNRFILHLGGLNIWFWGWIPDIMKKALPRSSVNKKLLSFRTPITILQDIESGLDIKIEFFGEQTVKREKESFDYLSAYYPFITVDSRTPLSVTEVNEIAVRCAQYFSFGIGALVPIISIKTDYVSRPFPDDFDPYLYIWKMGLRIIFNPEYYQYYRIREDVFSKRSTPFPTYFGFPAVKRIFGKSFSNFYLKLDKYKTLFNAGLQVVFNPEQYWESVFFAIAPALEFYYAAKGYRTVKINKKTFSAQAEKVISKLTARERGSFETTIRSSNDKPYKEKLIYLFNRLNPIFSLISPPIINRVDNIYKFRNDIAHGRSIPRAKSEEFVRTSEFAVVLCQVIILREMGIGPRIIASLINNSRGFSSKLNALRSPIRS